MSGPQTHRGHPAPPARGSLTSSSCPPAVLPAGVVAVVGGQGTEGAPREPDGAAGPPPLPRALGFGGSAPSIGLRAPAAAGEVFPARHLGAGFFGGGGAGDGGRRDTGTPRWLRGGGWGLAAARCLSGVPPIPAARGWGARCPRAPSPSPGAAGHARPLAGPRLLLCRGPGGPVATSPGVAVSPWVGAAGSHLLAVRAAAVGGVGALQRRVRLVGAAGVPDVGLLDLLGVDALPGGQDPKRGPPGTQGPGFGLHLGTSRPSSLPSTSHGAAFGRLSSPEEGATSSALAPSGDVTALGFCRAASVPQLCVGFAAGALQRRAQRAAVPQALQVAHLGVAGGLVLEAHAGWGGAPRAPGRAAGLPAGRVAQAAARRPLALPRDKAGPRRPAGLPAAGTDGRTDRQMDGRAAGAARSNSSASLSSPAGSAGTKGGDPTHSPLTALQPGRQLGNSTLLHKQCLPSASKHHESPQKYPAAKPQRAPEQGERSWGRKGTRCSRWDPGPAHAPFAKHARGFSVLNPRAVPRCRGFGTHLGRGVAGRSRRSWLARSGLVRAFMRARCSSCLACSWRGLSSSSCPGTKALRGGGVGGGQRGELAKNNRD